MSHLSASNSPLARTEQDEFTCVHYRGRTLCWFINVYLDCNRNHGNCFDNSQQASLKRRCTSTSLHGASSQKTAIFVLAAVKTSNLPKFLKVFVTYLPISYLYVFYGG
jgi:hypothetical protein